MCGAFLSRLSICSFLCFIVTLSVFTVYICISIDRSNQELDGANQLCFIARFAHNVSKKVLNVIFCKALLSSAALPTDPPGFPGSLNIVNLAWIA